MADFQVIAQLFKLYAASLPIPLDYQDLDAEIASLPGKYGFPAGELLLAFRGADALGCVGLRPLSPHRCEMKRLYLVPAARGSRLGERLVRMIIQAAAAKGYGELVLDTLPTMTVAIGLYERLGFQPIDPYYGPTPPGTIFMGLTLVPGAAG